MKSAEAEEENRRPKFDRRRRYRRFDSMYWQPKRGLREQWPSFSPCCLLEESFSLDSCPGNRSPRDSLRGPSNNGSVRSCAIALKKRGEHRRKSLLQCVHGSDGGDCPM